MKQKRWAVIRDVDRRTLIEFENKEEAFDCAASLRRLQNEVVHVEPLFTGKPQKKSEPPS